MLRAGVAPDSPREVFQFLRENARRRRIRTATPGRRTLAPPLNFVRKGRRGTQTRGELPYDEAFCWLHSNVRTLRFGRQAALRSQSIAAHELSPQPRLYRLCTN